MATRVISRWRGFHCCALAWTVILNGAVNLQLKVVAGDAAEYRIGSRTAHSVTVLVTDESGKPVANAIVSFRLPETGPSGAFNSGLRAEIVTTGPDGCASISGIQWNSNPGKVALRITALKDQARAGIISLQKLNDRAPQNETPAAVKIETPPLKPDSPAPSFEVAPAKSASEKFTAAPVKSAPVPPTNVAVAAADFAAVGPAPESAKAEELVPQPPSPGGEGVFTASHGGHAKWILIGVVVLGGVAAGVVLGMGKSSSSNPVTSATGITIGAPTIIVGHP